MELSCQHAYPPRQHGLLFISPTKSLYSYLRHDHVMLMASQRSPVFSVNPNQLLTTVTLDTLFNLFKHQSSHLENEDNIHLTDMLQI